MAAKVHPNSKNKYENTVTKFIYGQTFKIEQISSLKARTAFFLSAEANPIGLNCSRLDDNPITCPSSTTELCANASSKPAEATSLKAKYDNGIRRLECLSNRSLQRTSTCFVIDLICILEADLRLDCTSNSSK